MSCGGHTAPVKAAGRAGHTHKASDWREKCAQPQVQRATTGPAWRASGKRARCEGEVLATLAPAASPLPSVMEGFAHGLWGRGAGRLAPIPLTMTHPHLLERTESE